jgi:hypothetical protein
VPPELPPDSVARGGTGEPSLICLRMTTNFCGKIAQSPKHSELSGSLAGHDMLDQDFGANQDQAYATECLGDAAELSTEDAT